MEENKEHVREEECEKEGKDECSTGVKQTKKELFWEIFRFLLVGGTATLIDWAVAYLFQAWLLPPKLIGDALSLVFSTAFGFCVGLLVNWVLSVSFVFRKVKDEASVKTGKSFLTFTTIGLIGLAISIAGMQIVPFLPAFSLFGTSTFLGVTWGWWLMKGVMTAIVLVWNYVGRKLFIFKTK